MSVLLGRRSWWLREMAAVRVRGRWVAGGVGGAPAGFVCAGGWGNRRVCVAEGLRECFSGVAVVAEQGHRALTGGVCARGSGATFSLIAFGRGDGECSGCGVGREARVQPQTPEVSAVSCVVAIVCGIIRCWGV